MNDKKLLEFIKNCIRTARSGYELLSDKKDVPSWENILSENKLLQERIDQEKEN